MISGGCHDQGKVLGKPLGYDFATISDPGAFISVNFSVGNLIINVLGQLQFKQSLN